jgi:DNA-binding GntR family transcriptional regulator
VDAARHPLVASLPAKLKVHEQSKFEYSNQTESTYETLLVRILRGDFGPGEIIKGKRLAGQIGVNPITLHRAAEWLCRDGLLERLPRRGWRVTLLSTRDLKEAYDIRLLLEPSAVAAAVHRISKEELVDLKEQTDKVIALGEEASIYVRREADHRFHKIICLASGNQTLAEFLIPLIRRVLLITALGFRYERSVRAFIEHREILNAMFRRDENESVKRMKAHLRNAMTFNALR